jgi:hypothetical protein
VETKNEDVIMHNLATVEIKVNYKSVEEINKIHDRYMDNIEANKQGDVINAEYVKTQFGRFVSDIIKSIEVV